MSVVGALSYTYDFQIGLLPVSLFEVETLLVPVLYTRKGTILRLEGHDEVYIYVGVVIEMPNLPLRVLFEKCYIFV